MALMDTMIVLAVLFGIFLIVYSKVKDKDLKESFDDVKELVNPVEVTNG